MTKTTRFDFVPDITDPQFRAVRLRKIQTFLERIHARSELYREKFAAAGVRPDQVRTWEDFRALPIILDKADERRSQEASLAEDNHPLGKHLCVPPEEVLVATGTSGTTGMPAFSYQFTKGDLDSNIEVWARAARWLGIEKGNLVFDVMGYSMGPLGAPTLYAFWHLGIRAFPVPAESGSQRILYLMNLFRPQFVICTPSFAEYLAERAPDVIGKPVGDLRIKGIMMVGEPGAGLPAVREKLRAAYGAKLYDAQIGALGICNISCPADEYTGMHHLTPDLQVWPEDLVDFKGAPIEPSHGAVGRILLTSFIQEARPSLKLDMGDVWQVWTEPCPACGFKGLRYSIIGRTDDMLIVKGVNVYPAAIKDVVESFAPETTGHFRIVIDGKPPLVKPPLKLRLEYADGLDASAIAALDRKIRERMHGTLKVTPQIEMITAGSLPRSELKTRYIDVVGAH